MCSFFYGSGDTDNSYTDHKQIEIDSVVRSALNFIIESTGDIALQIAVNISEVAIRAAIHIPIDSVF
jgi:hypothetical protein